jgi:glycerol-3-phosphate dehydrogenase
MVVEVLDCIIHPAIPADMPSTFSREAQIDRLQSDKGPWDIVVIGGGATGVGVAVDAAARGYRVALLEQHDFGKGTSSRSTKLVHGGLRYLKQGRIQLVRDALIERGLLCKNAPHLVQPLLTIVPLHSRWESFYYGIGVKVYERLSGRLSIGPSRRLSLEEMRRAVPTIDTQHLYGGVSYYDGAFDDTRLLVNLVQTSIERGGVCVNYAPVRELVKEAGKVRGVVAEDLETGTTMRLAAKVVVNATGPFSDQILKLDNASASPVIAASQGIHLVFDREFLPSDAALIVPKTRDGRVIFAVPWHNHAVIGTTDTPRADLPLEPRPLPGEVDFLLETIAPYLTRKPRRQDIRSIFAGIRATRRSLAATMKCEPLRVGLFRFSAASGPPIARWPKIVSTSRRALPVWSRADARPNCCAFTAIRAIHTSQGSASTGRTPPRWKSALRRHRWPASI